MEPECLDPSWLSGPGPSLAEDLRQARLAGATVTLKLTANCDPLVVSGRVEHVLTTGAAAVVAGVHVPLRNVVEYEVFNEDR